MHMSEGNGSTPRMQGLHWLTITRELEGSSKRLLRIVPELRRGWISATHSGPEILGADYDAHGVGHQSV